MNSCYAVFTLSLLAGFLAGILLGTSGFSLSLARDSAEKGAHDMMMENASDMQSMMDDMMMGLRGKSGDDLDRAFLSEMIVHHQGALEMVEALLRETKRPELIKLGNEIISAQTREIDVMRGWMRDWYGN